LPMTKYKAVIFDMDGLMLDTERAARDAWRNALHDLAGPASDVDANAVYETMLGRTVVEARQRVLELLGPNFPVDEAFAREEAGIRAFLDRGENLTRPGLHKILSAIDDWGFLKAVATSTAREDALHSLRMAGLNGRFDEMAFGDEVARGKPAPDIYVLVAGRLGVAPEACLVLEDSSAGVLAGRAAGMVVIQVQDLDRRPVGEGDASVMVCQSLYEAREIMAALIGESAKD